MIAGPPDTLFYKKLELHKFSTKFDVVQLYSCTQYLPGVITGSTLNYPEPT